MVETEVLRPSQAPRFKRGTGGILLLDDLADSFGGRPTLDSEGALRDLELEDGVVEGVSDGRFFGVEAGVFFDLFISVSVILRSSAIRRPSFNRYTAIM